MESVRQTISKMREKGVSQLPVTSGGALVGIVSESDIMDYLASGAGTQEAKVSKCMTRQVRMVGAQTPISTVQENLRQSNAVVVVDDSKRPISIMTKIDLLDYLTTK
ncbi:MAG TPA: CBS domain-containing protein [bacterium]|nr:CBS domain-containing protein [bacterium]